MTASGAQHGSTRAALAATASLSVLSLLAGALVVSGRRLAGPDGWSAGQLRAWADGHPVSAVLVAVCLGALVVTAYLIVSTVAVLMAALARTARLSRLGRMAEIVAVPLVRRVLTAILGIGLAMSTAEPPAYAGSTTTVPHDEPAVPPTEPPSGVDPAVATMRLIEPMATTPLPPPLEPDIAPSADGPMSPAAPTSTDRWTIQPGDHLWGLSERALTSSGERAPSDVEIAAYLAAVIDLNQDVLVVPGEPDLVFPGQVFARPPLPHR